MKIIMATAAAVIALSTTSSAIAAAAPSLGEEVEEAIIDPGEWELESRWDSLHGGPLDRADVMKAELAYGITDKLRVSGRVQAERQPGSSRKVEAAGFEAVYSLGQTAGVWFALYGDYEMRFHGQPDSFEGKLLMQRKTNIWDLRLNLIAEKEFDGDDPVELEYAASADAQVTDNLLLGGEAVGELGTTKRFLRDTENYVGPMVKYEFGGGGPGVSLEAGYLFAVGHTREEAHGQLRLGVEYEFR